MIDAESVDFLLNPSPLGTELVTGRSNVPTANCQESILWKIHSSCETIWDGKVHCDVGRNVSSFDLVDKEFDSALWLGLLYCVPVVVVELKSNADRATGSSGLKREALDRFLLSGPEWRRFWRGSSKLCPGACPR